MSEYGNLDLEQDRTFLTITQGEEFYALDSDEWLSILSRAQRDPDSLSEPDLVQTAAKCAYTAKERRQFVIREIRCNPKRLMAISALTPKSHEANLRHLKGLGAVN